MDVALSRSYSRSENPSGRQIRGVALIVDAQDDLSAMRSTIVLGGSDRTAVMQWKSELSEFGVPLAQRSRENDVYRIGSLRYRLPRNAASGNRSPIRIVCKCANQKRGRLSAYSILRTTR
jgi:hypothetical protein